MSLIHLPLTFTHRLDNIIEFLRTVATYETLSLSRIEGIETFNNRFNLLVSTLKKKPYDPLEHRKPDFDVDYEDFKHQLSDLEVSIQGLFVKGYTEAVAEMIHDFLCLSKSAGSDSGLHGWLL